jgi:hypothetical protein
MVMNSLSTKPAHQNMPLFSVVVKLAKCLKPMSVLQSGGSHPKKGNIL